jgi:hypothetical protein
MRTATTGKFIFLQHPKNFKKLWKYLYCLKNKKKCEGCNVKSICPLDKKK